MSEVALDEIAVCVSVFGAVEIGPDGVTNKELLVLRNSYFQSCSYLVRSLEVHGALVSTTSVETPAYS